MKQKNSNPVELARQFSELVSNEDKLIVFGYLLGLMAKPGNAKKDAPIPTEDFQKPA